MAIFTLASPFHLNSTLDSTAHTHQESALVSDNSLTTSRPSDVFDWSGQHWHTIARLTAVIVLSWQHRMSTPTGFRPEWFGWHTRRPERKTCTLCSIMPTTWQGARLQPAVSFGMTAVCGHLKVHAHLLSTICSVRKDHPLTNSASKVFLGNVSTAVLKRWPCNQS